MGKKILLKKLTVLGAIFFGVIIFNVSRVDLVLAGDPLCDNDKDNNCPSSIPSVEEILKKDKDADKVDDEKDNCPDYYNPDQKDSNKDGKGDVCSEGPGAQMYNPPITPLTPPLPNLTTFSDLFGLMANIINFLLGAIGVLSFVYFVFNGVKLITSAGSAEKIGEVKESLFWAIMGIVFALASYIILQQALNLLLGI